MAMTKCKECKKEVSSSAKTCPNCGVSNPAMGAKELIIGFGFMAFLGWIAYIYFSGSHSQEDTDTKQVINAASQAPTPPASNAAQEAPPIKAATAQIKNPSKEDIQTAYDFCKESSKVLLQIDSSFKKLQAGTASSTKNKSPEAFLNALQAFSVRASELEEDASALSHPELEIQEANDAMSDMVLSVQGVARKNSEASENLQALLSSEQSPERTQDNAKKMGTERDYLTLKYSLSVIKLFNSLGYSADDMDDKTMCLKQSALNRPQKTST